MMSLKSFDLNTVQNLSDQTQERYPIYPNSVAGPEGYNNTELGKRQYQPVKTETLNNTMYVSNNSNDYTYNNQQLNGISATNSPISLPNSYYASSNSSAHTNISQSTYDPQITADLSATGDNRNIYASSAKDNFNGTSRVTPINPVYPPLQPSFHQPLSIHPTQADPSVHMNSNNFFASQEHLESPSSNTSTHSPSDFAKTEYATKSASSSNRLYSYPSGTHTDNISPEFYSQSSTSPSTLQSGFTRTQAANYSNTIPGYHHQLQPFQSNASIQHNLLQQSYLQHAYNTQSVAHTQDVAQVSGQNSWNNGNSYYMQPTSNQLSATSSLNLNLPFSNESQNQLASNQYLSTYNNGTSALNQGYPIGNQQIQLIQNSPGVSMAVLSSGFHGAIASNNHLADHTLQHMQVPINTWPAETHRIPFKSLVLRENISIHSFLNENLVCPNEVHELSTLYVAFSKTKKGKPTKIPAAASGRGISRMSKFKEKYIANSVNRVFLSPGVRGQPEICRQRHADNNPLTISREEFVSELASIFDYCISPQKDIDQNRIGKGDIGINFAQPEVGRGIPMQLSLPEGLSLVIDSRQKGEVESNFVSWKQLRTKPEHFFRMEDRHGQIFSLEELKEALDIIMSRPPRRINRYSCRQLMTEMNFSNGRGITEFNTHEMTLHMLSNQTRVEYNTLPLGAVPNDNSIPMSDEVKEIISNISPEDLPYQNSKKGSIYDPIWCRRTGVGKEGWCNHCKDGGWYLMKNSGFLYHKNHEHGIFPQGYVFEDPLVIRRKVIREARWEGQCGICYHWIDLDHTERKNWGTWYRHYKLCCAEYEEIKKIIKASGLPLDLIEVEYMPAS